MRRRRAVKARVVIGVAIVSCIALCGEEASFAKPRIKRVVNRPYPESFRRRVTQEVKQRAAALERDLKLEVRSKAGPRSVGDRALMALALMRAGMPPDSGAVKDALKQVRETPLKNTYHVAVSAMAIAAQYHPRLDIFPDQVDGGGKRVLPPVPKVTLKDKAWLRAAAKFLSSSQCLWEETRRLPTATNRRDPKRGARRPPGVVSQGRTHLPRGWGYPGDHRGNSVAEYIDISNTQYALLGHRAASRCGIDVSESVWFSALALLLKWQADRGEKVRLRGNETRGQHRLEWAETGSARGFSYSSPAGRGRSATGGMTAAGVGGLMICQSELWNSPQIDAQLKERTRVAIRDGLAWLQLHYSVGENPVPDDRERADPGAFVPKSTRWRGAYLYALERVGAMGHLRYLGEHDWFLEGATALMSDRNASRFRGDPSFELLFLTRGSFKNTNPVVTPR